MAKKFSKPELSRKINGDIPFDTVISDAPAATERFDILLLQQYPRHSRAAIQKLIKDGRAKVNGEVVAKPNTPIEEDAILELELPKIEGERPPVIYEDENVIVFNKPAGMLSIKKGAYLAEPSIDDFGIIVHRLDRDTSGVIIVAKDEATRGYLQRQFQERKTHKTYFAVTCGVPAPKHAMIDVPLARNLKRPTTFLPDPQGREAQTEYCVLRAGTERALVELKPRTGRTHQLRVHMNHIRCPILGDPIYNPKGPKADRMYLHAASLEITIPGREHGERMTFTADLPEDFERAIK